jgi:hypothetical protein
LTLTLRGSSSPGRPGLAGFSRKQSRAARDLHEYGMHVVDNHVTTVV